MTYHFHDVLDIVETVRRALVGHCVGQHAQMVSTMAVVKVEKPRAAAYERPGR